MFIVTKIILYRKYYYGWDRIMFVWKLDRNKARKYQTRKEAQQVAHYLQAEVESE